ARRDDLRGRDAAAQLAPSARGAARRGDRRARRGDFPRPCAAAWRRVGHGDHGSLPRAAAIGARPEGHRAAASSERAGDAPSAGGRVRHYGIGSMDQKITVRPKKSAGDTETILRHWREAVPNDRLAHLVKDATRALLRALQMRLTRHAVSIGHWTFLRI